MSLNMYMELRTNTAADIYLVCIERSREKPEYRDISEDGERPFSPAYAYVF